MRIGILGGTFNPIHLGHLKLAQEAMRQFKLDKVIFIPAYNSPFATSDDSASAIDRLAMLKIALKPYKMFEVSTYELDKKTTSYTIDTVKHFKSILNNDDSLFFIAGGDIAKRLPEWKDIKELCKLCTFVIAKRPGYEKNTQLENVQYIDIKAIDISSSMIRDLIKYGEPYQHTVPRDIFDYIKERKLYI